MQDDFPLGGCRFPPASEMEMHDPIGLLKLAALVAILRNSICSKSCSSAELVCMKQIRTYEFCKPRQCYVRFGPEADIARVSARLVRQIDCRSLQIEDINLQLHRGRVDSVV